MLNVDYSRRLKTTGVYAQTTKPMGSDFSARRGGKVFPLFIGAILLFTGGMVVGLNLGQSEENYRKTHSQEVAFKNMGESKPKVVDSGTIEPATKPNPNPTQDSPAFFPKNLKFPPQMDQINYVIEIGAYEPGESSRVGKLILQEFPDFRGRLFRTSTGKLFAGYFYKQEDAKKALEQLRSFEKDDFTDAELKTIRF